MNNQTGHIYVKLSNYYTATVRNIENFILLLNSKTEDKSILEIVEVSNVTAEFEKAIKSLIDQYKNPEKAAKKYIKIYSEIEALEVEKEEAQEKCYAVYELEHCTRPTQRKYLKKLATKQQAAVNRIAKKIETRRNKLEKIEQNITFEMIVILEKKGIEI